MRFINPFGGMARANQGAAVAAQQAYEARVRELWRQAANDAQRLAAAEKAYAEGDARTASRIYVRLALTNPPREATQKAKQRLKELAAEATREISQIDKTLEGENASVSASELYDPSARDKPAVRQWSDRVQASFDRYDELAKKYGGIPEVALQVSTHLRKQRAKPEYAMVLQEPKARALWELGQKHEIEDRICCAYWVYHEAAELAPAPSATLAQRRLETMEQDPKVLEAAEACRNLQECHQLYARAERIENARPSLARDYYAQVVARAPSDTELYRAAKQKVNELGE